MVQWTNADPGAGSLGQVDGSITNVSAMATEIDTVLQSTTAVKNSVGPDLWSGSASVAWHASALGAMSNLPSMRNTLTASVTAMQTYRDTVADIDARAQHWMTTLDTTTENIHGSFPFRWPWEVDQMRQDELDRERNLERHYEAIAQLAALGGERETADAALIAELSEALPTDWPQQHAAFVAAGLTEADQITTESVLEAMEDLALEFSDFDNGGDTDVDALSSLMDLYSNDETMMSSFFTRLGGANTLAVVDRIGADASQGRFEAENLLLAQRIRDGLSLGSADWDAETAEAFAEDMFTGNQDYFLEAGIYTGNSVYGRPEAIAWLFSSPDEHPMGAQLSLASAVQIDEYERVNGGHPWKDFAYATGGPNAAALWMLENPDAEGYFPIDDTAGLIFQNLALHPELSAGFLDPTQGDGAERIEYWYGERDWSDISGFEAPGDLWFAAQSIPGGPLDENWTVEGSTLAAEISSHIMEQLAGNEHFVPGSLSDGGAASIANNIALNLPGFADYMYSRDAQDPNATAGSYLATIFGSDETRPVPFASTEVLAELLGTVVHHEDGAAIIETRVTQLQDIYLAAAASDPGTYLEHAIGRTSSIQAVIDGAGIGSALAEAANADAASDARIDGLMEAINLIPIPGISKVFVEGGVRIIDMAQSIAVGAGKSELVDAWKESLHVYDGLAADLELDAFEQGKVVQVQNTILLYEAFGESVPGIEAPPAQEPGETTEAYLERSWEWAKTAGTAIEGATGIDVRFTQALYEDRRELYSEYAEQGGTSEP